jgi:hypothetical protein
LCRVRIVCTSSIIVLGYHINSDKTATETEIKFAAATVSFCSLNRKPNLPETECSLKKHETKQNETAVLERCWDVEADPDPAGS